MARTTNPLLENLAFPEGPRWHDERLWFSDMVGQRVMAVGLDGSVETIVELDDKPSGLGWLPDGRLLVVSMEKRRLLRLDPGGLQVVADLSTIAPFHCNDMLVDGAGVATIGNFGFDFRAGQAMAGTVLIRVDPDGQTRVVAEDLIFPNGMVLTPDGATLVVAETMAGLLTAFDVAGDGGLSNRRVWANLSGSYPDGMCLDAEGAIWVAMPNSRSVIRVREGGEVVDRVTVGTDAFACMLGGPERRHLFICTASDSIPEACLLNRDGRIEVVEVDVPGVGLP